jgi:hypothetical protein
MKMALFSLLSFRREAWHDYLPRSFPGASLPRPGSADRDVPAAPGLALSLGMTVPHTRTPEAAEVTNPWGPELLDSDPPPTVAVPGYEVLGLLGKGGMGVVYKAATAPSAVSWR